MGAASGLLYFVALGGLKARPERTRMKKPLREATQKIAKIILNSF
jgi:hypothetical protein